MSYIPSLDDLIPKSRDVYIVHPGNIDKFKDILDEVLEKPNLYNFNYFVSNLAPKDAVLFIKGE